MKIVHITRQFLDVSFGGVEQHIYSVASEQAKLGNEVKVIRIGSRKLGNYSSDKFNFQFVEFGKALEQVHDSQTKHSLFGEVLNRLQSNMYSKIQYKNLIAAIGDTDVVHFHDFLGIIRVSKSLAASHKVFWTNHLGEFLLLSRAPLGSKLTKVLTSQFRFAIGPSRELADSRNLGCPVKYIPNGCNEFVPDDSQDIKISDLRSSFNLSDEKVFLVPRRWAPTKGVKQLTEALKNVDLQGKAFFVFVGRGEGNYGKYRDSVTQDLTECKSRFKVVERVPPDEMLRYYQLSDFTVIPSLEEATSLAALQAMALSSLVLATPVGGLLELIEDGTTGLLARDTSSEAISELLMRALEMTRERSEVIRKCALAKVTDSFLWNQISAQVMEMYVHP